MVASGESGWPQRVQKILARARALDPGPLVLRIDERRQLVSQHGDGQALGLPPLHTGHPLEALLPFLTGSELSRRQRLDCIDPGTGHALDIDYVPAADGGAWLVMTSAERRRREREALQLTANEMRLATQRQQRLVDQLIETRTELEMRRREAEEALRVNSRFIASMSHEFRTPLTSVIGYAQWLTDSLDGPALGQARSIVSAGQHMLNLVDNLLAEASLQGEGLSAREDRVRLRGIAEDISAIMAPLAADKGLAFAVFVDPQVPATLLLDDMRLRQVLINLLGNAVKFTDDGFVNLGLSWTDAQLHVEVADSGPGIAERDRARIFSAFERLDGTHGKSGAGLGLHITLQIVKLLGGSIGLDSTPGEGTRFHVRLPAPVAPDESPAGRQRQSGRILIAEDDRDVVELLHLYLARAGYDVRLVDNGRDAVDAARADSPDVVVLDLNMPVLGGLDAVRELRASGFTKPVIALTGATLDEERLRAAEAGFDAFVAKPIRMPRLVETIDELLR